MTEVKYNIGNGHEISVEYDEHNITKITKECLELLIEKQIPKKPIIKTNAYNRKFYECPNCRIDIANVIFSQYKYCRKCGQRIDWGNEDDRAD